MFNKLIYKAGVRLRNPSLSSCYQELKLTEFASSDKLKDLQCKKLAELCQFCYLHSSYYKDIFDNLGLDPFKEKVDFEFLSKLPILKKESLIKYNASIHTIDSFNFKKMFFSETSGSTGQALTFYKDEEWDSFNRASINRGLSWYNIKPWYKNGYFWGFNFSLLNKFKIKFLDSLLCRFRLFSYSDDDLNKFLVKSKKAVYLEGYSSMIYEVAKLANKKEVKLNNIKFIKGTSEKIYDHYHLETKKAFGQKIVSEYGSAESGIIAFECPVGNMHLNEETCIVENVDGRAIVTNLVAKSFPTIRYDLGDYIELSTAQCSCGRSHKVLKEVTGRVGKNILGMNHEKFPSLTLYYVFKNLALNSGVELAYRCEQHQVGYLKVFIESNITEKLSMLLQQEFHKYFQESIKCEFITVDTVRVPGRKLKDFESFIGETFD